MSHRRHAVVELFAGCGGLSAGLSRAGFDHVALVENDPHAFKTLTCNATSGGWTATHVIMADVRGLDVSQWRGVDLLAAGVPCQPFSKGGLGNGHEDERNMFPATLEAIRAMLPKAIVIENVFGLLGTAFQDYFAYVIAQLRHPEVSIGRAKTWRDHWKRIKLHDRECRGEYEVEYRTLDAADFGIPQRRRRVFILARRVDTGIGISWPPQTHSRQALLTQQASGEYWERHGLRRGVGDHAQGRSDLLPWRTVRDALSGLGPPQSSAGSTPSGHFAIPGARSYAKHTGSLMDSPAKTLKAGVHGVAGGEGTLIDDDGVIRYFTVREAARLQDFPDVYEFPDIRTRAMRQIGNAVPVGLAESLGSAIVSFFDASPESE